MWLGLPILVLVVGLVAGAVAREAAREPHVLGDVGPWVFGVGGAAVGALLGWLIGGGDIEQDTEQWWALLLSVAGAAIAAGAFVAVSGRTRSEQTNVEARDPSTPVAPGRGGSGATASGA